MVKQKVNLDFENSSRIVNHPSAIASNDVVIKSDLDSAIAQLSGIALKAPQDIDCSSNPDYPACDAGQSFQVTVGGKIGGAGGIDVNIGDTIFCKSNTGSSGGDRATAGADFFIVEGNRENASESINGLIRLASQTEVNNGTEATKAVTSLTLNTRLNTAFNTRRYSTTIGDNTSTSFVITHGLGDANPIVQVRETNAPFEEVNVNVSWIDANNISISTINPLTTNELTVFIKS